MSTMAACSDDYYCLQGSQLPSLAWNLDDLAAVTGAAEFASTGLLGILNEHVLVVQPPETASELSTGYLEDAVAQWSDRSKRRRTLHFPHDHPAEEMEGAIVEDLGQGFWNSNCHIDTFPACSNVVTASGEPSLMCSIPCGKEVTTSGADHDGPKLIGDPDQLISASSSSSSPAGRMDDDDDIPQTRASCAPGKRTAATRPAAAAPVLLSSAGFPPAAAGHDSFPVKEREGQYYYSCAGQMRKNSTTKKKTAARRVVYPFAVVRPGGVVDGTGVTTLKDINRRLLMRPTRPIRHPVGEFACLPCVSGDGPGLSGKAVVGITRIQTRGRGTITIIRTKG